MEEEEEEEESQEAAAVVMTKAVSESEEEEEVEEVEEEEEEESQAISATGSNSFVSEEDNLIPQRRQETSDESTSDESISDETDAVETGAESESLGSNHADSDTSQMVVLAKSMMEESDSEYSTNASASVSVSDEVEKEECKSTIVVGAMPKEVALSDKSSVNIGDISTHGLRHDEVITGISLNLQVVFKLLLHFVSRLYR